jgi:hypothetical protein
MRPWVDPGTTSKFADVHGAIGYRTRGRVPVQAERTRGWSWLTGPTSGRG